MTLASALRSAGFPEDTPVSLAALDRRGGIESIVSGRWPDGSVVAETDRFYAASLSKQLTAAAAARLVGAGRLDIDAPVARHVAGLPGWASEVTARQLAQHLAGLPADDEIDFGPASGHWTEERVMRLLRGLSALPRRPGEAYAYSNVGYVLLAQVVARAAGKPFAEVVSETLLGPLEIGDMAFAGPEMRLFPQTALLGTVLPLTVGDGGLWCTAAAFVRWLRAMNSNLLNIDGLVTQPGRLSNGMLTDYGWGIGLRKYRAAPLYVHGGAWPGAVARAVRSPSLGIAVAALAAGPSIDAMSALVDAVVEAQVVT